MHRPKRAGFARVSILLALVALAMLLASASTALAVPAAPTMTLAELEAKLQAEPDGSLTGYFETVVRGDTPVQVPCEVLAVTGGATDSLILFESSGPVIDKYGGIAQGMSGSPVYVDDGGTPALVGAVSYGDWFTLGGTGLATPIEDMLAIEDAYAPKVVTLESPVIAGNRVIKSVIVAEDPEKYAGAAAEGAFVAKPLSSVFIGGLRPQSTVYRRFAGRMKSKGLDVVPLSVPLGGTAMKGGVPYYADFAPGGTVTALGARGDIWYGGLGTVTYTSGSTVLAFGHPIFWEGPSSTYMTNGWVDGIWPSSNTPYKLGRPGAVHGAFTQDRYAGIMGLTDAMLAETTVTATATNVDTGESADSAAYLPTDFIFALDDGRSYALPAAAYVAGGSLFDQWMIPGSALTTTTVVVSDGTDEHTVTMKNMFDNGWDVAGSCVSDVDRAVWEFLLANGNGLAHPKILSVHLESEITAQRRSAQIVSLDAPDGLQAGADNAVTVSLLKYGVEATQTIETTLYIPEDTRIEGGILTAVAAGGGMDSGNQYVEGEEPPSEEVVIDRRSVADVVEQLNDSLPNNAMTVSFVAGPELDDEGMPIESDGQETPEPVAEATVLTDSVLMGAAEKLATGLTVFVDPPAATYGGECSVFGELVGAEQGTVYIYGTEAGQTDEVLLGSGTAEYLGPTALYEITLTGLKKNTALRAVYEGDADTLPCEAASEVQVKAKVSLYTSATTVKAGSKIKFTAKVWPTSSAGSSVVFEYYSTRLGAWRSFSTKTLAVPAGATYASASYSWAPPKTVKTRVRFLGCATNVANKSAVKTVYVK